LSESNFHRLYIGLHGVDQVSVVRVDVRYRCLHGEAPSSLLRPSTQLLYGPSPLICQRPNTSALIVHGVVTRHLSTARSRWLQQEPGTPYHLPFGVLLHDSLPRRTQDCSIQVVIPCRVCRLTILTCASSLVYWLSCDL